MFALCRWNEPLAQKIVGMIFHAIAKHSEVCRRVRCLLFTLLLLFYFLYNLLHISPAFVTIASFFYSVFIFTLIKFI